MKILLLEDDLELCNEIQLQLIKNGYVVDTCHDGETAMLYALNTEYSYDLAIADRMLPIIADLTVPRMAESRALTAEQMTIW